MMVTIDHEACDRCGTCISVCRANALLLDSGGLVIDGSRCTRCGTCVDICAFAALALSSGAPHGSPASKLLEQDRG